MTDARALVILDASHLPVLLELTCGTGLGLFNARGLIEAQAGEIDFESESASGTTFLSRSPEGPEPRALRAQPACETKRPPSS